MSKLYLTAETDMRGGVTSTANKYVDAAVGYDEKNIQKQIKFKVFRDSGYTTAQKQEPAQLQILLYDSKNKNRMVECKGNEKDGILSCKVKKM